MKKQQTDGSLAILFGILFTILAVMMLYGWLTR